MEKRKLTSADMHMLKLIQRYADKTGWALVSTQVLPLVQKLPIQLVSFGTAGTPSASYVRLTREAKNLLAAMEWL